MTEDEMVWHHRLNGHGFGWTLGVGDGQGGLACCSSWGRKESDMTEQLNLTEPGNHKNIFLFLQELRSASYMVDILNIELNWCLEDNMMWQREERRCVHLEEPKLLLNVIICLPHHSPGAAEYSWRKVTKPIDWSCYLSGPQHSWISLKRCFPILHFLQISHPSPSLRGKQKLLDANPSNELPLQPLNFLEGCFQWQGLENSTSFINKVILSTGTSTRAYCWASDFGLPSSMMSSSLSLPPTSFLGQPQCNTG